MIGDDALWRSVEQTLRDVVVPALAPGHERDLAVALTGIARWAPRRRAFEARDDRADAEVLVAALDAPSPQALSVRRELVDRLDGEIACYAPLLETFAGHPAADVAAVPREVPERDGLERWFGSMLDSAVLMSGGHSRRMVRVRIGSADFVVRIEQGGLFGTDGTAEARLMRALRAAGVPVPPVPWIEPDPGPLGSPFFVMEFVPGSSEVTEAALDAFVDALAALHRVDPAVLGPVPPDPVQDQVSRWFDVYRRAAPRRIPLLEEAAEWLRRNLRPTGPPVVVHGDPGPGNFLHDSGRIVALTDWEFAHLGDPAEDWTYLATIRGRKLMDTAAWRARLAELAPLDDADWRAWDAFNQFKGACANLTALALFRDGTVTTPTLVAIGTAVHARFLRRLADLVAGS